MIDGKKIVAIIPARGGSKRIPGKNIKKLSGKPLIAWSIKAGLESKYVDDVIVSTDDLEIAKISVKYGADVPFIRPDSLSTDFAKSVNVLQHAIDFLNKSGSNYDYLVLLQPTSPLRNAKHIDEAMALLAKKNADAVIGVCKVHDNPLWSNIIPEDLSISSFLNSDVIGKRSQDVDDYYKVNGAIYICNIDRFIREKTLFIREKIFAYKMTREDSIDIDNNIDFELAKIYLSSVE